MKHCSVCKAEKAFSEFHRRNDRPSGYASKCKACKAASAADYREKNLEVARQRSLDWHNRNKERSIATTRAWQERNADVLAERRRQYREDTREERRAQWREWRDANRDAWRALRAKRRAALKQALPVWADMAAIKSVYEEALRLTAATGVEYHVDHIIPLQHPLVCGLHVAENLRAIPKQENQRKYNKWAPTDGMPSRGPSFEQIAGQ